MLSLCLLKCEYFKFLNLKMVDEKDIPIPFFKWSELFLRIDDNANYSEFENRATKISYNNIHGLELPSMFHENQNLL